MNEQVSVCCECEHEFKRDSAGTGIPPGPGTASLAFPQTGIILTWFQKAQSREEEMAAAGFQPKQQRGQKLHHCSQIPSFFWSASSSTSTIGRSPFTMTRARAAVTLVGLPMMAARASARVGEQHYSFGCHDGVSCGGSQCPVLCQETGSSSSTVVARAC